MSIKIARTTLGRAFAELRRAEDREDERQAGEKGWRAAREAVYTVMRLADKDISLKGTVSYHTVQSFEKQFFGSAGGTSHPMATGYAHAMQFLHGECFYEDECAFDMETELGHVGALIEKVEEYIRILGSAYNLKSRRNRKTKGKR